MKKIIYISICQFLSLMFLAQSADTWQTLNTKFTDVSGIIHAPAKDTLFIHRTDGSLLRSFNGGSSWDSTFIKHDSIYFTEMGSYFLNGKVGFTWSIWSCMYLGGKREVPMLLKTTNSGTTWVPIMNGLTDNPISFSLVHFWDENNGFALGSCINSHGASGGHLHVNHTYMTVNGGANWVRNLLPEMDTIKNTPTMVSFYDEYNGIMMGKEIDLNASITTNGAFSWKNTNLHKFAYNATGVKMINSATTFILSNDSLYFSSDSLKTITRRKLPFVHYNNTVMMNNASFYNHYNTTYFLTFNDPIYKSSDNFNTFEISKPKNNEANYSLAGYGNDVYVYATNGSVYKTATITSIKDSKQNKQTTLILYPNPTTDDVIYFNTSTKIKSYTITNNSGAEITNSKIDSNTISTIGLPSGVYLVSFYDSTNNLVATKKIIKQCK